MSIDSSKPSYAADESPRVREARMKAYTLMRPPSEMGIICIDVTNKCDLACSNCTRLLVNQDKFWDMSPDNFRLALRSLAGYPGTIAMIGGNPCMHPKFEELCRIFVEEVPNKAQRGLWTNNAFKHAEQSKETFGFFNLNPHNSERGVKSLEPLKDLGVYYEGHSEHSSLLAAIKDLYEPVEMWDRISRCDINQNWSASIVQVRGVLKAYFCEVAASFDLARGGEHGVDVVPGWWKRPIGAFCSQIDRFCPGCGVPAKVKGHMDHEEIDTYSESNADIAEKAATKKKRRIAKVDKSSFQPLEDKPVTLYSNNLVSHGPRIFVVTPYYQESLDVLSRCHESVRAQRIDARLTHVMIADGHARSEIDTWGVEHVRLPRAHGDNGNTARAVGGMIAAAEDADFVAYLDADNWFYPEHLASLLAAHRQTQAAIACSFRHFYSPGGELLPITEADEDAVAHVDTSCMLIHRSAFAVNSTWTEMPRQLSPICDRVFFAAMKHKRYTICSTRARTVGFTSTYLPHYQSSGRTPPPDAKPGSFDEQLAFLHSADGVRQTVDRLGFWPG